jgi:endonuclease/exonuclease/phosphatase (EEP) superfamily protein YafD
MRYHRGDVLKDSQQHEEENPDQEERKPASSPVIVLIAGLVTAGAALCCAFSAAGFLGSFHWALDMFNAFHVQYGALLIVSCAVMCLMRRYVRGAIFGAFGALNLILVLPVYFAGIPDVPEGAACARLLSFNVRTANDNYEGVSRYILSRDPDVILLLEIDHKWWTNLEAIRKAYPHSERRERSDNFGIALLSRIPFSRVETVALSKAGVPTIIAALDAPAGQFRLLAAHPIAPMDTRRFELRNTELQRLAELAAQTEGPVIIAGDLNTSAWSPHFRTLLDRSGLRDSRRGFGIHATWPVFMKFFYTPIDHVLVSDEISVHDRTIGPELGSDHLPVCVDISISPRRCTPGSNRSPRE